MMIGIGVDIVHIARIKKIIERYGNKFIKRVFTHTEILYSLRHKKKIEYFAKRFAAKEACVKALGYGFGKYATKKEIETISNSRGKPIIQISGKALKTMKNQLPPESKARLHISLSDDNGNAIAIVLFESI